MSEEQPYKPIACSIHDQLLAYATLRTIVKVTYEEGGEKLETQGTIADVFTKEKAEYLQMKDGPTFRLDHLLSVEKSIN